MRRAFPRFKELNERALNVELHVHTSRTDGTHGVLDILDTASSRGIETIAFTEHVRRSTDWFPAFSEEIRAAARCFPDMDVLVGCEAKVLDTAGSLDASDEILGLADIVLGSVHRIPDGTGGCRSFQDMTPEELGEIECELAIALLRFAPIDALAHPGGMYQRRYGVFPESLMRSILSESLERDVAVEISSSYLRDFTGFLDLCAELNPRISIGSDAHRAEDVGTCRDRLQQALMARSA